MKKIIKKILLTIIVMLIVANKNVFAEEVKIVDVINNLANDNIIVDSLKSDIEATYNDVTKILTITINNTFSTDFKYESGALVQDYRSTTITDAEFEKSMSRMIVYPCLIEAIYTSAGYPGKIINNEYNLDGSLYSTYGLTMQSKKYSSSTMNGDFISYFNISLDKSKIAKAVADYGMDISQDNSGTTGGGSSNSGSSDTGNNNSNTNTENNNNSNTNTNPNTNTNNTTNKNEGSVNYDKELTTDKKEEKNPSTGVFSYIELLFGIYLVYIISSYILRKTNPMKKI